MTQAQETLDRLLPAGESIAPGAYAACVRELVAATVTPTSQRLPLQQAAGRQLAEPLYALIPQPSFANSQMDGYALTSSAAQGEARIFRVGPDIPAGAPVSGLPVADDVVYPVMTGAPVPAGYTTVVPVERSRQLLGQTDAAGFVGEGGQVELPQASPGAFVRSVGEDVAAGQLLADTGSRLTPALLGALAAQGIGEVEVYRPLHLLIITGGDEVASAGAAPAPGQIFDANGPVLTALAHQDGCTTDHLPIGDSVENFIAALAGALAERTPDVIVTSGGISHGKYEVVRLGLAALAADPAARGAAAGGTVRVLAHWFGHATQQPGGPQGLALLGLPTGRVLPVVCLPGNPVSTLISYHLLLRPALAHLMGEEREDARGQLMLEAPLAAPESKTQYRRARLIRQAQPDGSVLTLLAPSAATGSHLLLHAAQADALVELEPGRTYRGGELVRYIPL
ncbi:molybdopterin molybdotransferase MoeA [Rothia nasimurium]|uniref:molybdopterin molybdotransferase MoeA n=1 Tax=Rothia nasimurium TaxID=85336 RepID=UPI001F482380|nr:molybdopterin molybdotransferase MoeA [Rothia nasimurium]